MRKLSLEQMEKVDGIGSAWLCGVGIGMAVFSGGTMAVIGLGIAAIGCLTSDTR